MSLSITATQVVIKTAISKEKKTPYYYFEVIPAPKPVRKYLNALNKDAKIQMVLASLAESQQPVDIRLIQTGDNNYDVDHDFII